MLSAGRTIRGSKKRQRDHRRLMDTSTSTSTANFKSTSTDNNNSSSNALRMNTSSSKSIPNQSVDDLLSLAFTPPPTTTTNTNTTNPPQTNGTATTSSTLTKPKLPNIFSDLFIDNFDDQIWPLQMIDPRDKEQYDILYPLLYKLPYMIMYYLNEIIFPEVLAHQGLKLSTCG